MSGSFLLEVMLLKLMAWKFTSNVGVTSQSWHVLNRSDLQMCDWICVLVCVRERGFAVIFLNTAAVTEAV